MEVKSKRSRGHHLPCLSGLSQAPLLPLASDHNNNSNNGIGSERSTPISLAFNSPKHITQSQPASNSRVISTSGANNSNGNKQPNSSHQILNSRQSSVVGTPLPSASFFFPPLPPARSSQNNGSNKSSALEHTSNRSPKFDINMNNTEQQHLHHECGGREPSSSSSLHSSPIGAFSQQHQTLSSIMTGHNHHSSKLNSPLLPNFPAKPFNDAHLAFSRPAFAHSSSNSNNGNAGNWQQDDNYHLYHEPIDPDEQQQLPPSLPSNSSSEKSPKSCPQSAPTIDLLSSLQHQHPTTFPKSSATSSTVANSTNNTDWPFASSYQNKSPTTTTRTSNVIASTSAHHLKSISSTVVDQSNESNRQNKDVSADIYSAYVSLKPGERSNHRSRSYHGPKNPTLSQNQNHLAPYHKDATKNLSSTSVAGQASISQAAAFAATMIKDYDAGSLCVRELVETERNYVIALEMILTDFAKPLENTLRREDYQLIFGHIKYFHQIHSNFQADLNKAAVLRSYKKDLASLTSTARNSGNNGSNGGGATLTPSNYQSSTASSNPTTPTLVGNNIPQLFSSFSPLPSPTVPVSPSPITGATTAYNSGTNSSKNSYKISTCFLNIKDKFLKYGEYCASLSKTQALLDDLTNKNETIAMQLDRCQHEANEGKFKLRDLLSLPMQRILKYHLLLAQLIKNTSSAHEDYLGLKRAHETMVDLGQYINEVKRDTEALQIINEIEQSITGLNMPPNTQLTDYGRLITDGYIRIFKATPDTKLKQAHESRLKLPHETKTKQKDQKRYVFVFDKVMLICKLGGVKGYQYKEALVLSEFELDLNPVLTKHETKEKWSYSFNLVRQIDDTVYTFYAKTAENKTKWTDSIDKAMDNIRPAVCRQQETNHEFLMHTFDKASSCDHCGKLLHGLYYQGYRCRTCFSSAHKKCLALVRPCGPALPPKTTSTLLHSRRCKEPPSPSIRSNCSDEGHGNMFVTFPSPTLANSQCVDASTLKNEYSNIDSRTLESKATTINPSLSFRESTSSKTMMVQARPVSSMINVSQQNSTNNQLQQRRLLKGSTSTPAISGRTRLRAIAIADFDGDEEVGQLKIRVNDSILVYRGSTAREESRGEVDHSMAQLRINNRQDPDKDNDSMGNGFSWCFGRNERTSLEGEFPSHVVELLSDQLTIDARKGSELENEAFENHMPISARRPADGSVSGCNGTTGKSYVNFILTDCDWFCGRMERDSAHTLLEGLQHGTFLVRVSPKHYGSYVISLNYNGQVKHMRIHVSKDNLLYLSQNRYFKSIIELVSWYEKNSLQESFHMLDAHLAIPYKSKKNYQQQ